MQRSKTTQAAIAELYAVLATAAARRAVSRVSDWGDIAGAETLATAAVKWLDKSSAEAVRWTYRKPAI